MHLIRKSQSISRSLEKKWMGASWEERSNNEYIKVDLVKS